MEVRMRIIWLLSCGAGLFVLTGCGGGESYPTAMVKGTITFEGTPVPTGAVVLHGKENTVVRTGPIDNNGNFEIPDAPQGKVNVNIDFPPTVSRKGVPPKIKIPDGPAIPEVVKLIPAKYKNYAKSGLVYTITPGRNEIKIELKKN